MAAKGKKTGGRRRGRGEGDTGAKEGATEVRQPGMDLVVIKDDDFDLHFRALKNAVERQKQAKNLYDGVCKGAKKVSEDLLAAIKKALKFEGMSPEDIKRQLEIDGYALKRIENPIQMTVFDTLEGDQEDLVYKRGFAAGRAGETLASKYPEGSTLHAIYARAWRHGTADNLGISKEDSDKAYAESVAEAAAAAEDGAGSGEVREPIH